MPLWIAGGALINDGALMVNTRMLLWITLYSLALLELASYSTYYYIN